MKNKVIVLSLLFLVFIIALAPARLVQNLLPNNSNITLENMSGSVWSGSVEKASAHGWELAGIDYQISFLNLLLASAAGDVSIGKGDVVGDFDFSASDAKNLSLSNANLETTADKLATLIPFPGIELEGDLSTQAFEATLTEQKITHLAGTTSWKNAIVTVNKQRWELGEFTVEWTTNDSDQQILGRLKKTKNLLQLEGNVSLNASGVLEFNGSISSATDRNLYTALSLFANGKVELGRLPIKFKKKIQ